MYEVCSYTEDTFEKVILSLPNNENIDLNGKLQLDYLKGYLGEDGICSKTIVIEQKYIDHDYLEDYAGYYARCFLPYSRECSRLHFFSSDFSKQDFENILRSEISSVSVNALQETYLGFIVIKPLPKTFIGRTCLRHYDDIDAPRKFHTTHIFTANLFGIKLTVRTLPYQEQDKSAAACATAALWSAFHGTGRLFQHSIPSPVEITKLATSGVPADSRALPTPGLNTYQMAQAIREIGLEPYAIAATDEQIFKNELYGYLRGKIPILLLFGFYDAPLYERKHNGIWDDRHAVTIAGYSLGDRLPQKSQGINLTSSRIEKIYAHDDQIGPFARMELCNHDLKYRDSDDNEQKESDFFGLKTSWPSRADETAKVIALPQSLIIPLYHKIRIPFNSILNSVKPFDFLLQSVFQNAFSDSSILFEWDIYLTTVNEFKNEILSSANVPLRGRQNVLTKSMPRFLWIATMKVDDTQIIDLCFDATDIEQGILLNDIIEYNESYSKFLRSLPLHILEQTPAKNIANGFQ